MSVPEEGLGLRSYSLANHLLIYTEGHVHGQQFVMGGVGVRGESEG